MSTLPLLLLLCCVAVPSANAQQLYKAVGPDGKVVYSDKPPITDATKLSVMRSYTLRPVEPPAPATKPGELKRAKTSAPQFPTSVVSPQVEETMLAVMIFVPYERRFEHFCVSSSDAAKAFAAGNASWRKRNEPYIYQQKRLLMEVFSPQRRAEMVERAETLLQKEALKLRALNPGARATWCEQKGEMLSGSAIDMNNPEMLAIPIYPYRAQ